MPWRTEVTNCKGPNCRARIVWMLHAGSKRRMCFDAEPISEADALRDPRGVFFQDEDGHAVGWAPMSLLETGPLFRSHWGVCPDRDSFRKATS